MPIFLILGEIMESRGLSVADVAHLCDLPDSTVRGIIKRQQKTIALDVAFKLSHGLGVSIESLGGYSDTNKKSPSVNRKGIHDEQLEQLYRYWDILNEDGRQKLLDQAEQIAALEKNQAGRQTGTVSA